MTTTSATSDEVAAYLTTRGFTHNPRMNWYEHRWARVAVVDAEAACFDVCALSRDLHGWLAWQARLTHAPLAVFAATVTAAID